MDIYDFHLNRSPMKRYALAVIIFLLALLLRFLLLPIESGEVFITFFPAIVLGFYAWLLCLRCRSRPTMYWA